ncbi:uncharacterized protein LOC121384483 [Gigantopelta aegis]|uniref:uncharacterized protein LOC121384483 n=1 Tax=Gigantopelta aegis TaxID=1735272 RepID=UPI001B887577|nr:uncharacterized protein LOC121384483 [Gigantopelta aegis]
MRGLLRLVLAIMMCTMTKAGGNDFDFTAVDADNSFSFGTDLNSIVLDASSIHGDKAKGDGGIMAGVDLEALDAQIEKIAAGDLDSILDELKGYHDMTDNDSESPENGGPIFKSSGFDFSSDSKLSKYETFIKKLEAMHGVTPTDESKEAQSVFGENTAGGNFDMFGGAAITGLDFGSKTKKGPSLVELTSRAQYLKDTFHKDVCTTNPCKNSGVCSLDGASYTCKCTKGYMGKKCEDTDHCANSPCVNGECVSTKSSYTCNCQAGYQGDRCQTAINYCANDPCKNGKCISGTTGYHCQCSPGYQGTHCETATNYCESNPCVNGDCASSTSGYTCTCYSGYQGDRCEKATNYCESNPCVNGDCDSSTSGYTCTCYSGYQGDRCEKATNYCASNPCVNGDCDSSTSGYTCTCYSGYQGDRCEKDEVFTSCKELHNKYPKAEDGEYWLSPAPFNGRKVKIFCLGMATGPMEFVTLKAFNRGNYPNLSFLNCQDANSKQRNNRAKLEGSYVFSKVRVNIKTMVLDVNDYIFATTTGVKRPYGTAADCYSIHYGGGLAKCGTKGYFDIDTSGTGMIIRESTRWKATGWNPIAIVKKSMDYYKIRLECGGWCGGCEPTSPLMLEYKEHVPDGQWEGQPSSCVDLKKRGKTHDGQYLVWPRILDGWEVNVYCHLMNTKAPKEYITLKHTNRGEHPNIETVNCKYDTVSRYAKLSGKTSFYKVRIIIETMVVVSDDYTFAKTTGYKAIPFGHASDAYNWHRDLKKSKCGPVGKFVIDMRGTGLKVDDNLSWLPLGSLQYGSWFRSNDNAVVHINCGGFPGSCKPIELMTLVPNPKDVK